MFTLKQPAIIDVYEGEYPVDFAGMMPFVAILKASGKFYDGYRRRDHKVTEYSQQCKTLGIKTGLYHFLLPNNITEQAQLFLEVWDELGADLPPIVDVECDPRLWNVGYSTWAGHVKAFCDRVEAHTGRKPIIYTSLYFWSFTGQPAWAKDYPLWLAWYPDRPDNHAVPPASIIPHGWDKWALWQYHDKGRTNGFLANDLNMASDWFLAEIGTQPQPEPPVVEPEPEPQPTPTITGKVTAPRGVYVRTGPTTSSDIVGGYACGTPVVGLGFVNAGLYRWLHLSEGFYAATGTQDGKQTYIEIAGENYKPKPVKLWRVRHDKDPNNPRWNGLPRQTMELITPPEVYPAYVSPNEGHGTARTRMARHGWEGHLLWLNPDCFDQAVDPNRCMFNGPRVMDKPFENRDNMESLFFGGTPVTGEVVGAFLKVETMKYLDGPPQPYLSYWDDPLRVQRAVVVHARTGEIIPGWAKIPNIYYPVVCGQDVYLPLKWLEPFPALPLTVTVTAHSLNMRAEPRYGSPVVDGLFKNEMVTITEYTLHADEVWARVEGESSAWIALLYKGYEFTTWRMFTKPVV